MGNGGEGEIRTHGRFPYAGFQDRYLKPLGHFSFSYRQIGPFAKRTSPNTEGFQLFSFAQIDLAVFVSLLTTDPIFAYVFVLGLYVYIV